MIELQNVRKTFDNGATFAVADASFTVERGELLGLIGDSGCGKTTTVCFDDRLADCQAESHAVWLGGVKCLEDLLDAPLKAIPQSATCEYNLRGRDWLAQKDSNLHLPA